MRDVMKQTGLSRQAIHFYVEQGLVPPPTKTSATTGFYSEAHVERILLVKKLQEEHFLPLKAIRAMLDGETGDFTRAQHQVLRDVKARLPAAVIGVDDSAVPLAPLLEQTQLSRRDVTELERAGFVTVSKGRVTNAWIVELWGEVRAAGFTRELGFGPELLEIFSSAVDAMFDQEKQILSRLLAELPAAKVAAMIERALPLVHSYLIRLHQTRVRALFAEAA